ncbi:MAG: peptidylprolyl isomerase, partial [Pelagibacteraceae bacterium]
QQKPFVLWFTGLSASGKYTIAIIVEKGVITEREIQDSLLINIDKTKKSSLPKSELEKIRKEVIKVLIEKKLITQYAIKINLTPTEQEIDKIIENILKNNQISEEELKIQLENDGGNINLFRDDIKFNLTVQKIKDREIMPFVNVSEYEIDAWLKKNKNNSETEYKISHILIKKSNPNKEQVLSKIKEIKNPSDFLKIAQEFSDGPNAENFGDMGWKKIEDLPEIFTDFVKQSKNGEISEAIESSNGIHFLQVESIRNEMITSSIIVKQYKFQQILIKHNSISDNEDQLKKMNNFRNIKLDGLNYSESVKLYSED